MGFGWVRRTVLLLDLALSLHCGALRAALLGSDLACLAQRSALLDSLARCFVPFLIPCRLAVPSGMSPQSLSSETRLQDV